jgi:hypothetical protein
MVCYLEVDTFQVFRTSPTKHMDKQIETEHSSQSLVKVMSC